MIITFIGHSEISNRDLVKNKVTEALREQIDTDTRVVFYCGGYGDFDNICAEACSAIKKEKPLCEIIYVTPYIGPSYQQKLKAIEETRLYDAILYPPLETVPFRYAILKRNEWMVDEADLVIAYVIRERGGAYKSMRYAIRKNKHIFNLAKQKC